jgi:hypothetical protein
MYLSILLGTKRKGQVPGGTCTLSLEWKMRKQQRTIKD